MNQLDAQTKAMLDAGSIVILNGKYLVMTSETLKQAVQDDLIVTIGDKEEANDSSMCSMCGGGDIVGTACSSLILETGYGCANDLERVTVPICGECADRLYVEITQMSGARIDDIQI